MDEHDSYTSGGLNLHYTKNGNAIPNVNKKFMDVPFSVKIILVFDGNTEGVTSLKAIQKL